MYLEQKLFYTNQQQNMTILQPYFRLCRPFANNSYFKSIDHNYLLDSKYASDRVDFVRAYHLLERELINIFNFVEPDDKNKNCYSHQIYSLLMRASTEFESNAKAILQANGYNKKGSLNIEDFFKLNIATKLDEYQITIPIWNGNDLKSFNPFGEWSRGQRLSWYQNYNDVKHNRFDKFSLASLENASKAVGAVLVILTAQFHCNAFDLTVTEHCEDNGTMSHNACLLSVKLPEWPEAERYDFQWENLLTTSCQQYSF